MQKAKGHPATPIPSDPRITMRNPASSGEISRADLFEDLDSSSKAGRPSWKGVQRTISQGAELRQRRTYTTPG